MNAILKDKDTQDQLEKIGFMDDRRYTRRMPTPMCSRKRKRWGEIIQQHRPGRKRASPVFSHNV